MKKLFSVLLLLCMSTFVLPTFAVETNTVEVPKWEDYVPSKYHNPRTDVSRGSAIAEMAVGIELTALIVTSPIGIPMICHGSTKFKHFSYNGRKAKFEAGLKEAEKITDLAERQAYYTKLLKKCKLKESDKIKLAEKKAKRLEKQAKKAEKLAEKEAKKAEKEAKKNMKKAQKEAKKLEKMNKKENIE